MAAVEIPMTIHGLLRNGRKHFASDIHVLAGMPPVFRIDGEIVTVKGDALTSEQCRELAFECLNEEQRKQLEAQWQLCYSTTFGERDRARVTIYMRNGTPELSVRLSEPVIRARDVRRLPAIVDDLVRKPHGLIIISGPTGVGKTTTFHYMIDHINNEKRCKIVTIEDPIEYTHAGKRSIVVQQEVLSDVHSF